MTQPSFGLMLWCIFFPAVQALESLGFSVVFWAAQPAATSNAAPIIVKLSNAQTKDTATVAAVYGFINGTSVLKAKYVEFQTKYTNDETLIINNNGSPGSFKPVLGSRTFRFPELTDIAQLYGLHHAVLRQYGPGLEKVLPTHGTELDQVVQSMIKSLGTQVKAGLLRFDQAEGCYRPTVVGAYLMTWALLWPIKQIKSADQATKMRGVRAELKA